MLCYHQDMKRVCVPVLTTVCQHLQSHTSVPL